MTLPLIFWACFFLVAYTYLLYPAVLFLASSAARLWRGARVAPEAGSLPAGSAIIPAPNEGRHPPAQPANPAALQDPKDRPGVPLRSPRPPHPPHQAPRPAAAPA